MRQGSDVWLEPGASSLGGVGADISTVTVFGSFGYGNVGDELVPSCVERLSAESGYPIRARPVTRFRSGKLDGIIYLQPEDKALASALAGKVILCGGGIIEPRDMSCLNQLVLAGRRVGGARFMPFAISTDHSVRYSWRQSRGIRRALGHLPEVYVRDDLSNEALQKLLPGQTVTTVGDIALWLRAEEPPADLFRPLDTPSIAVTLGDRWTSDDFISYMADEIARASRQLDMSIDLIPISNTVGPDVEIHTRLQECLRERHGVEARLSLFSGAAILKPGWIAYAYASSAVVVGMRLHACVMAYSQRTPFVAIAYHPKVAGFCKTIAWSDFVLPARLPKQQDDGSYGYRFETLALKRNDLAERIEAALEAPDFSALDFYRRRQRTLWPSIADWLTEP